MCLYRCVWYSMICQTSPGGDAFPSAPVQFPGMFCLAQSVLKQNFELQGKNRLILYKNMDFCFLQKHQKSYRLQASFTHGHDKLLAEKYVPLEEACALVPPKPHHSLSILSTKSVCLHMCSYLRGKEHFIAVLALSKRV